MTLPRSHRFSRWHRRLALLVPVLCASLASYAASGSPRQILANDAIAAGGTFDQAVHYEHGESVRREAEVSWRRADEWVQGLRSGIQR